MSSPIPPEFEGFARLHEQLRFPDISHTALEFLLANEPKYWGLGKHDERIGQLLDGNFDLEDAGGSFFKNRETWREWKKGISEVGILSIWANSGILETTVYPNASQGSTSAFDAGLTVGGQIFGADIKFATTAASGLILDRFEPMVERWASSKDVEVPEIEVQIVGQMDLRRLQPKWGQIDQELESGLNSQTNDVVTVSLDCPLPGDIHDIPDASNLEINLRLLPPGTHPNHSWKKLSLYEDKSGAVRLPSVEFAESIILHHATKKSQNFDDNGNPLPFILAYYQENLGDLRMDSVATAMKSLQGPPNFYGVMFVDDMVSPPVTTFYPHVHGQFSPGNEPEVLEMRLQQ